MSGTQDAFNLNDWPFNTIRHMAAIRQRNQQIPQARAQVDAIHAQTVIDPIGGNVTRIGQRNSSDTIVSIKQGIVRGNQA